MARRATKIKEERAASPYVLLLDAGNSIYGDQALTQITQGRVVITAMNLMGYDAMALGAGDFRLGLEVLQARIAEARFPILSANVLAADTRQPFVTPYVIKKVGGYRIAILGLTDVGEIETILGQDARALKLLDPLETARRTVAELCPQADVLIVLSHLGTQLNRQLADTVPGIDVIVGGLVAEWPKEPWRSQVNGTLLVEAEIPSTGYAGRQIGVLRLQLEGAHGITGYTWENVTITPDYSDDPDMSALLERYSTQ
ncbi:MAG: bifunctional metallophosphatase/5'-nucleotidase [Anaerolineae bacterium]|nr:bifunctional metallophosphatase/5'-nucleotidase [Anaerolineae bacterium]